MRESERVFNNLYFFTSEICNEMLELYGAAKKEKPQKKSLSEKVEPSPNNSSSQSSPSVTNSPPFKKKVPFFFFLVIKQKNIRDKIRYSTVIGVITL